MTDMRALIRFIQGYLGRQNVGTTVPNLGQCVGLVEEWLAVSDKPLLPGNAVDLLASARSAGVATTVNTPTNYPQPGDIVCWDGTWGNGYGHCAIVIAATEMKLAVFEQNDPVGSPPTVATHDYSGVAGWIWW